MSYKVIKDFTDLQDGGHVYHTGDTFPRDGADVTKGRIEELASNKNRRKEALIEKANKTLPTKSELAAQLTNPELAEAIEAKQKAAEKAEKSPVKSETRSIKGKSSSKKKTAKENKKEN